MLPILERPDIKRVLIEGLGGGNTLAGVPSSVEEIDVIELEPEVVEANRQVQDRSDGDPLADPRVRLLLGDARGALTLADTKYDAIISQPSHPWTSGASHLYTREFFELAHSRLRPGGVFAQWIGLGFVDEALMSSLLATLLDVFPHLEVFRPMSPAILFMGSDEPLDIMSSAERAIAAAPESFAIDGIYRLEDVASFLILDTAGSRALADGAYINTDDHNRLATRQLLEKWEPSSPFFDAQDPLPARLDRLDTSLLSRRLFATGQRERLSRLAEKLPESERQIAAGWLKFDAGGKRSAKKHFEKALETDPDSQGARDALSILQRSDFDHGNLAPRVSALIESVRASKEKDLETIAALDDSLALWQPGDLFFDEATRARISWRLRSEDPVRGAEAVEMIEILVARGHKTNVYLLLARAARLAGRTDLAWAALGEYVTHHRGSVTPAVRREVRSVSRLLPDSPYREAVSVALGASRM